MNEILTKVEYKSYYIAYFDIQGYQYYIEENEEEFFFKVHSFYLFFHANMQTIYNAYKEYVTNGIFNEAKTIKYRIFSDNILLYVPISENERINSINLDLLADSCLNLQCQFCRIGIKVRGCITKGDMFINKDFVFGKGLIKAVNMEKEAKHFRIIIDDDIDISKLHLIKASIDINDGKHFLDYLAYYFGDNSRTQEMRTNFIQSHFEMITDIPKTPELKEKREWISFYHNVFCSKNDLTEFEIII